jgi:hypothetical protein
LREEKNIVLAFFSVVAINQICPQEGTKIKKNGIAKKESSLLLIRRLNS